jgi:hypothetical protein
MSYDWHISDLLHLKAEPYYQYLYDVPVSPDSPFSIINHNVFYLDKHLVNNGKGVNYGIDLTLEHYLSKGYYYMLTSSLFDSRYSGGDGIWRNTRFNRRFLINALGGKEWMTGKKKQNIFGVSLRLTYQGGDHYTPLDEAASQTQKRPVLDDSRTMECQMKPAFISSFTINFKINRKKVSHEFAYKVINAGGYEEFQGYAYYFRTNESKMATGAVIVPNLSYKLEF